VQRITALLAIGSVVVTACSSGVSAESTTVPPAAAECIAIADDTVAMLQDMIAAVEALPANELPDSTDSAALLNSLDTDTFFELRGRADSLGTRGQELECSDAEGQGLVLDRVDQLRATTAIGVAMRDGIIRGIEQTQVN
jgi:hypothetical protein